MTTPDLTKLAVAQAVLGRFPNKGDRPRDIALTGPTLLAEVVSRTPLSVTIRVRDDDSHGLSRYFEIKVTEKL